jgi:outer membrane lipoprotein-sorting protein
MVKKKNDLSRMKKGDYFKFHNKKILYKIVQTDTNGTIYYDVRTEKRYKTNIYDADFQSGVMQYIY